MRTAPCSNNGMKAPLRHLPGERWNAISAGGRSISTSGRERPIAVEYPKASTAAASVMTYLRIVVTR
jgi:hypothetical protein